MWAGPTQKKKKTNFLFDINHILSYNKYKLTKEKEMKKEVLTLKILNWNVTVEHSGNKYFREQETGMTELQSYLSDAVMKGERKGFVPYDNFECSFNWEVK